MAECGVFILLERTDNEDFNTECITELMKLIGESDQISEVHNAEDGLKVYLTNPSWVQFLCCFHRFVIVNDQKCPMYPLTTALTVYVASKGNKQDTENHIRGELQQLLGPVLEISQVPFSKALPHIASNKVRVIIDLPEIEDQYIFRNAGLPDDMTMAPLSGDTEYKVTFHCMACDKDGHTQSNCPENEGREMPDMKSVSAAKIKIKEERCSTERFASVVGEEEVRRYSKKTKKRKASGSEPPPKKTRSTRSSASTSTSYVEDDESEDVPKIVSFQSVSPDASFSHRNSTDDSGQVSTSGFLHDLEQLAHTIKQDLDSSSEDDGHPRKPLPFTTPARRTRKPAKLLPVIIPPRIKALIDEHQGDAAVMDSDKLEAFLNHVKKKSSPAAVAEEYTGDVDGFFMQLIDLKERYYAQRDMGDSDERKFMKDFGNLVSRFHNKPKPRCRRKE